MVLSLSELPVQDTSSLALWLAWQRGGASPFVATAWAVYLHGEAGRDWVERNGQLGLLAREIPNHIPRLMQSMASLSSGGRRAT